jgi:hypothetical protein
VSDRLNCPRRRNRKEPSTHLPMWHASEERASPQRHATSQRARHQAAAENWTANTFSLRPSVGMSVCPFCCFRMDFCWLSGWVVHRTGGEVGGGGCKGHVEWCEEGVQVFLGERDDLGGCGACVLLWRRPCLFFPSCQLPCGECPLPLLASKWHLRFLRILRNTHTHTHTHTFALFSLLYTLSLTHTDTRTRYLVFLHAFTSLRDLIAFHTNTHHLHQMAALSPERMAEVRVCVCLSVCVCVCVCIFRCVCL